MLQARLSPVSGPQGPQEEFRVQSKCRGSLCRLSIKALWISARSLDCYDYNGLESKGKSMEPQEGVVHLQLKGSSGEADGAVGSRKGGHGGTKNTCQ